MIEKDKFHIFNYIKKEEYCASMDGMRYMLKKQKKPKDLPLVSQSSMALQIQATKLQRMIPKQLPMMRKTPTTAV